MKAVEQADELHGYRHNGEHVGSAYRWPDGSWIVCVEGTRFEVEDADAARFELAWKGSTQIREGE